MINVAYCTNIHPGESWIEIKNQLAIHVPQIRKKLGTTENIAIGLYLSDLATKDLLTYPEEITHFIQWMKEQHVEITTANAFPFGKFHGTRVKEQVFLPDWTSLDRLKYTKRVFQILDALAPQGRSISVSTLPGSHKSFLKKDEDLIPLIREMGRFLIDFSKKTGRDCHLGFEPEPYGQFDTTNESIAFLNKVFHNQPDAQQLQKRLGITYDTCHFALQYETPQIALKKFANAGIRISKIQASNALRLNPHTPQSLTLLKSFDEPTYFHQVVVQKNGQTIVFPDMDNVFDWAKKTDDIGNEWRCHFHIPIDKHPQNPLLDTTDHLQDVINYQNNHPEFTPHWETETYTWAVLPPQLQTDLDTQIAHEIAWVQNKLQEFKII